MITLIRARHVIGFDGRDHVLHRDAEVAFAGDRILYVGPRFDGNVDAEIDAGEAIVSPGFVDLDALADIDHALLDTWHGAETENGLQWSADYFRHRRHDVFGFDDVVFRREYALSQLIRNGVTTAMPIAAETHNEWAETYAEMAAMADVAGRLGLRMYMGPSYRAGVNVVTDDGERDVLFDAPRGDQGLANAIRFVEDFAGAADGLIRGCLLPCRIETLTPALMAATAQAAERLDCLVRLHCLQGRVELALLRRRYDQAPLDMLEEAGLLNRRLLIPHGIFIGGYSRSGKPAGNDLERLAKSGATIIHCPLTSVRSGNVLESFDRYRAAGIPIALGTDTFPPDMVRVMDYGSNLAKVVDKRSDAGKAADFFRAATLDGARALGRDDLGRLAPGAKADLVVFDIADPRFGPVDDPVRTLILNGSGANVRTVVIDGRTVMRNRIIPGQDEAAMRTRAQDYFVRMKAAYGERDVRRRSIDQLFPPSFRMAD